MSKLKQTMTLADVVALGVSAAMGVSIFSVVAPATAVAGPAMLVSLALAAGPMVIFAIVYAFMNAASPRSGASYAWPTDFVHPLVGFMVCWLRIVGCAGGMHIMATVFVSYLSRVADVPAMPVVIGVISFAAVTNLLGASTVGRVAQLLVALKLIVLGSFIVLGLPEVRAASFEPFAPFGALGILGALPLLVSLYTGIESATEAGEEIRDSRSVMKKGLAIAVSIGMVIYLGTAVVTIGTLGASATGASAAPLSDAAAGFFGPWTAPIIVVTALVSIVAAMNALTLVFARFLFAMGRDGSLPSILSSVNDRFGTPHMAILAAYGCALLSLLLPQDLLFLFLAANLPTMLKYGANCVASIRLIRHRHDLVSLAAFGLRTTTMTRLSWIGLASAAIMIVGGATADWRPYAVLGGWALLGLCYWLIWGRRGSTAMSDRARPAEAGSGQPV